MDKKHISWVIPNEVEICVIDGRPSIDCVSDNPSQNLIDAESIMLWEKSKENIGKSLDEMSKFIKNKRKEAGEIALK